MNRNIRVCFSIFFLIGICVASLHAQPNNGVDAVTVKGGKIYAVQGSHWEILTGNLKFTYDVLVSTNGTFKVGKKGKDRRLGEGQVIRRDGWLLNPDGSVQPVYDHVAIKEGKTLVVRDGVAAPITSPIIFPNNFSISPDAMAGAARLDDGRLFRMDGTPIPAKDTATLRNGRVVVQKDGTMIPLAPVQVMGMDDRTRVYGNGQIQKPDGSTIQLHEGETYFIEGIGN